jgi:hypothetical protein
MRVPKEGHNEATRHNNPQEHYLVKNSKLRVKYLFKGRRSTFVPSILTSKSPAVMSRIVYLFCMLLTINRDCFLKGINRMSFKAET